MLIALP